MDTWLYVHVVRSRDLIAEAQDAHARRAARPRRGTLFRPPSS